MVDSWMQQHVQYIKNSSFEAFGESYVYPSINHEAIVSDVLLHGYGVCEDISASIAAIMKFLKIETYVVCKNGHAWNVIRLDNRWFIWDCTHNITRNKRKVNNELKAMEYSSEYLLRGANYDAEEYLEYTPFFDRVSDEDFPREQISEAVKILMTQNLIPSSYGGFTTYSRSV